MPARRGLGVGAGTSMLEMCARSCFFKGPLVLLATRRCLYCTAVTQKLNGLRPYHFAVATIISGCLEELLGLIGSDEPSLASRRSLPRAWKCCCWRMPEAHKCLPNPSAVYPSDLWVHALFLVSLEPGPSAWLSFRLANAERPPDFFWLLLHWGLAQTAHEFWFNSAG